jgi:hypothetical protein
MFRFNVLGFRDGVGGVVCLFYCVKGECGEEAVR